MKARRSLALICYTVCIAACLAAGVVSFMAYRDKLTYTFGFLLFAPIWIGSYWFLSFFNALSREKNGKKIRFIVKKSLTKGLSAVANVISVLLLCFWVYIFVFRILPGSGSKADNNDVSGAGSAAAAVCVI